VEKKSMRKTGWLWALLMLLSGNAWAVEVGLVTALSGGVTLQEEKSAASELKPFVKLREGDRLTLQEKSRVQLVFFDGGRQETWQGAGAIEVGSISSKVVKGGVQAEVRTLPAILVKQLSKTPALDGSVKAGVIRMRSISSGGTLEAVEKDYADLRQNAEAGDRSPELYLLASYLELREFDKLEGVLKALREKNPGDSQIAALNALYSRAVSSAKTADKR
jgi:hypothetical protein